MTTYFRREAACANCAQTSEHQVLGSTNSFGSADLDLRPPEMQRSTMRAWLQRCPHCGYVAPDIDARDGDLALVGTPAYAAVLADARFPELARLFLARAVLVAADPAESGYARLRAAWACDDTGQNAEAAECRSGAASDLARLKPFADDVNGITTGAVLVDALRRAGRWDEAATECRELLAMSGTQGLVREVLELQSRLIAQRDAAAHTVSEAAGQ